MRPDITQRLAESFETALRLADGIASVAIIDDKQKTRTSKFFLQNLPVQFVVIA